MDVVDQIPLSKCSSTEGSLHDELLNPHPNPDCKGPSNPEPFNHVNVHASRPCYRCVTYIHSVGIRRAFWTNDSGEWEGAKVRDLVDALDRSGDNDGINGCGMFVTKHEVLMMRKLVGGSS